MLTLIVDLSICTELNTWGSIALGDVSSNKPLALKMQRQLPIQSVPVLHSSYQEGQLYVLAFTSASKSMSYPTCPHPLLL